MGNSWNWKQTLAFFLLFVPALAFYALQKRWLDSSQGTPLQKPAHWIQMSYDEFTHIIQESVDTYLDLVSVNTLNSQLKVENAKLSSQVQLLEEYRSENIRLRELFKFQQELPRKTLAARVISKDIVQVGNSFTIDKGSADGVKRLRGVISADGVVGYTFEVDENSSRVLLLSSQGASIDALIQRTRARGIVAGINSQSCELKYMMRQEDAQKGDLVVTSGRQGIFPKGFIIGHVKGVEPSPTAVSYRANVEPSVKLDRLENVLVIIEKEKEEKENTQASQ